MSTGIAEMFANSNRQARQNMRLNIFTESHSSSVTLTIIFAVLVTFLLGGDWVIDTDHSIKSLMLRGGIFAVLMLSALVKKLSKSIYFNYGVAYLSLLTCENALVFLLNGIRQWP